MLCVHHCQHFLRKLCLLAKISPAQYSPHPLSQIHQPLTVSRGPSLGTICLWSLWCNFMWHWFWVFLRWCFWKKSDLNLSTEWKDVHSSMFVSIIQFFWVPDRPRLHLFSFFLFLPMDIAASGSWDLKLWDFHQWSPDSEAFGLRYGLHY